MVSESESSPLTSPVLRSPVERMLLNALMLAAIGYCILSSLTVAFVNRVWLGEIPLLALIQIPKLELARVILIKVLMPAFKSLGLSRGSFSPDYILGRPYALALAYLIGLGLVLGVLALRTRLRPPYRRRALILLGLAAVDYVLTTLFINSRGLSLF